MADSLPLVTLAVPTFRRPLLLRRALASVALQTYPNLEVLVVDNATEGDGVEQAVAAYAPRIPGLRFIKHAQNIGPVANFFHALAEAGGELFMWLADDDELSPTAVADMVAVFADTPEAVTVAPHWLLKLSPEGGQRMPMRGYEQAHWLRRACRFAWQANDGFFYALHRTAVLRRARKLDYTWPNRGLLANWAYPYLLDMVLAGKVLPVRSPEAVWINHEYSEKSYARPSGSLANALRHGARRVNVHALYALKVWQRGGLLPVLVLLPVSAASLLREVLGGVLRKLRRRLGGAAPTDPQGTGRA